MKKEENINRYVKKSTAAVVALICLIVGFAGGILYKKLVSTERKVSKRRVQQPEFQTPQPRTNPLKQVLELQKKVVDNPEDAAAWAGLGHIYFDTNEFENAIQAYRKHLELKPDNADVWADLGVMYRRMGKPEEAVKAFDKAMTINPWHKQSRFNKGIVYLHDLKDPAGALKAWEDLLKVNPAVKTPDGRSLKELVEQLRKQVGSANNQ
jgi:cytochrome c-type biogenesis protein CcmH/NrfG